MDRLADLLQEVRLAEALNRGDRRLLLDAPGRSGAIARAFARGDHEVIQACVRRFAQSRSPVFGMFLRWLIGRDASWMCPPGLEPHGEAFAAEHVFSGTEGEVQVSPQDLRAYELSDLQRRGLWKEWDAWMHDARVTMEWDARLAIAEARAHRERFRDTAWEELKSANEQFPDHFTIAQMYGLEIVWACGTGVISVPNARELWNPLERYLSIDPDDYHLSLAKLALDQADKPEGASFDPAAEMAPLQRRREKLLAEVHATVID